MRDIQNVKGTYGTSSPWMTLKTILLRSMTGYGTTPSRELVEHVYYFELKLVSIAVEQMFNDAKLDVATFHALTTEQALCRRRRSLQLLSV